MLVIRACVRTWASAAARASGGAESRSTGEIRGMLALREKVRRSTQCREFPGTREEEEDLQSTRRDATCRFRYQRPRGVVRSSYTTPPAPALECNIRLFPT